jgi:purine-binding chemotaxis protein CheW
MEADRHSVQVGGQSAERDRSSSAQLSVDDTEIGSLPITVFSVDSQRYGVPVAVTERVLPMVAISPLPGAPHAALGVINLHGDVVPVLDVRRRLGLAAREYGPAARLLVARSRLRVVALAVDDVAGVTDVEATAVKPPDAVLPGIEHVSGVAAVPDGLILIHDLDAFFSIEEERQLAASLAEVQQ